MFPFPDHHSNYSSTIERPPFSGLLELTHSPLKLDFSSSTSFFPFSPTSFNHDTNLHDLLLSAQLDETRSAAAPQPPTATTATVAVTPPPTKKTAGISRKRAVRKDRHSKIFTAQGPRDRRMRLSLEVARKFFDLQDILGFDKASKTVQWLLNESKASIKTLMINAATASKHNSSGGGAGSSKSTEGSTSELEYCDGISDDKGKSVATTTTQEEEAITPKKRNAGPPRPLRRPQFPPMVARESRAKARARARERTRDKKSRMLQCGSMDDQWKKVLPSMVPFDQFTEEAGSQDRGSSLDQLVVEADEQRSTSTINHHQCKQRPITILDYNDQGSLCANDTVSLFQEQWDINYAGSIGDAHQLQTGCRQWEAYGNHSSNN